MEKQRGMWSELEIMSQAGVEFRQHNLGRERWQRITVEWKQLEGEGVGVDGRHKAEPRALALPCSAWLPCLPCLPACLERREGGTNPLMPPSSLQSLVGPKNCCSLLFHCIEPGWWINATFFIHTEAVTPGERPKLTCCGTGLGKG